MFRLGRFGLVAGGEVEDGKLESMKLSGGVIIDWEWDCGLWERRPLIILLTAGDDGSALH
jgi:hypothetical protein